MYSCSFALTATLLGLTIASPLLNLTPRDGSIIPGYTYQGCYTDSTNARVLGDQTLMDYSMTLEMCQASCSSDFFGVEYGRECWCGSALDSSAILKSDTECSFTCPGNSEEQCGAGDRISVYSIILTVDPATVTYTALGCYTDSSFTDSTNGRTLSEKAIYSDSMTIESCASICSGYNYFGVEYSRECYCADFVAATSTIALSMDCAMACSGTSSEICGGDSKINLYTFAATATSTATSSPTSSPAPKYTSMGCYTDSTGDRALSENTNDDNMTIEKCETLASGYIYYGVEYGKECWYGNTLKASSVAAAATDCYYICPGNSGESCGAGDRLNLYQLAITSIITTTSTTIITSATTTSATTSSTTTSDLSCTSITPCSYYYSIVSGDTCYGLANERSKIGWTALFAYNPILNDGYVKCNYLAVGETYCLGGPVTSTISCSSTSTTQLSSSTSSSSPTVTSASGSSISSLPSSTTDISSSSSDVSSSSLSSSTSIQTTDSLSSILTSSSTSMEPSTSTVLLTGSESFSSSTASSSTLPTSTISPSTSASTVLVSFTVSSSSDIPSSTSQTTSTTTSNPQISTISTFVTSATSTSTSTSSSSSISTSVAPVCTLTNPISNGGFEDNPDNSWKNSNTGIGTGSYTSTTVGIAPHSDLGKGRVQLSFNTAVVNVYQDISVCPGFAYNFSGWARRVSNTGGLTCQVTYKANGVMIAKSTFSTAAGQALQWTESVGVLLSDTATVQIMMTVTCPLSLGLSTTYGIFLDDVVLSLAV